jgi:hypothetical protein
MNVKKIFIDRHKHQQTESEMVINNVPMFITAPGIGGSIQTAKVRTHTGKLCIAAFSYLVMNMPSPPSPSKN